MNKPTKSKRPEKVRAVKAWTAKVHYYVTAPRMCQSDVHLYGVDLPAWMRAGMTVRVTPTPKARPRNGK